MFDEYMGFDYIIRELSLTNCNGGYRLSCSKDIHDYFFSSLVLWIKLKGEING